MLSNGTFWFDFRWALGGTAIVIGLVLLANSLRRKSIKTQLMTKGALIGHFV